MRRCRTCRCLLDAGEFRDQYARQCDGCRAAVVPPEEKRRRCVACKESKLPAEYHCGQSRKCAACHTLDALPDECRRCTGPIDDDARPDGKGHWLCADCRVIPPASALRRPPRGWLRCQKVKPVEAFAWGPGRGKGLYRRRSGVCEVCREAEREEKARRRRQARKAPFELADGRLVRRCSACREVKDLHADFYVQNRRQPERVLSRWRYSCKRCDVARCTEINRRKLQTPEGKAKRRLWQDRWRRRNPERYREMQRAHAARVKADPERHAKRLEADRLAYKLRRERQDGVDVTKLVTFSKVAMPRDKIRMLPALPLARKIDLLVRKDELALGTNGSTEGAVCAQLGIDPRQLFAWRKGEIELVQFDVADRVLTNAGWLPFDVWDDEVLASAV